MQWGTGHEHSTLETVRHGAFGTDLSHAFKQFPLLVPQSVRFVDNCNAERDLADDVKVSDQSVVSGDEHVEFQEFGGVRFIFEIPLILSKDVAPNSLPIMVNTTNDVCPPFEFAAPMFNGRQRNYNEVRAADFLHTKQMLDVANNLNCFAETHFV